MIYDMMLLREVNRQMYLNVWSLPGAPVWAALKLWVLPIRLQTTKKLQQSTQKVTL